MITAVIFDMYETLARNPSDLWLETFKNICLAQGLDVDYRLLFQEWKSLEMVFRKERMNLEAPEQSPPFKTYGEAWSDCFVQAFDKLGLKGDAAVAAGDAVRDLGQREPYPDAKEALPVIQAGWRTGVLSNADNGFLFPLLENLGWQFETVLSSEQARAYKPLPAPFLQVLEKLGVEPGEVVYVGDSLYDDILGAKGVGMRAAWVNRYGAERSSKYPRPDFEIRSLTELPEMLEPVR